MRVKFLFKDPKEIPEFIRNNGCLEKNDQFYMCTVGKEYVVYGITIVNGNLKYYICDDEYLRYPVPVPFYLFEITDNHPSRFWISVSKQSEKYKYFGLIFPEFNENSFYENLIEAEPREISIFNEYKRRMDLEFPNTNIIEAAEIGDGDWLICPKCIDAWFWPSDRDALVVCPKCATIYNNPRYSVI